MPTGIPSFCIQHFAFCISLGGIAMLELLIILAAVYLFAIRCLVVNGLFAINAMFFTMSGSQLLQAVRGFFRL
jgi:hypothetical protein